MQKPAGIADPLADKVEWSPAAGGGANFKTQTLYSASKTQLRTKKTMGATLFSLVFILPGLGVFLFAVPFSLLDGQILTSFFLLLWSVGFTAGGSFLWYRFSTPFVFDKTTGLYYKGKPVQPDAVKSANQQGELSAIHAVQLVAEYVRSGANKKSSGSYYSYELNLVFSDGSRVNVMDHGEGVAIEQEAETLAEFLGVPVWRGT